MSEFINKLRSSDAISNILDEVEKDRACVVEVLIAAENEFKDWKPPKPKIEVPQFVADWFENNEDDLSFKIWGYLINWKLQDKKSDFFKWMKNESECIEILIRMQDGYTVKKEQLFILKHIDMSKFSELGSLYLSRSINEDVFEKYDHRRLPDDADMSKVIDCHFTQSEIDELHTGSYEQIEVEP